MAHSSIDEQENEHQDKKQKKEKSRRPGNTAFKQQRLKAWQPILTPKTVLPLFFAIGIIFAPIGGLLLWASAQVSEIVIDYTECANPSVGSSNFTTIPTSKFHGSFYKPSAQAKQPPTWKYSVNSSDVPENQTTCFLQFQLESDFKPPVLLYYRLTNFYQNHRRYVKSVEEDQLQGKALSAASLNHSDGCSPLVTNHEGKPYYPCGLIANSVFNDTFLMPSWQNPPTGKSPQTYEMTTKGIAWDSDKARFGVTKYNPSEVVPPPNWNQSIYKNGYTAENLPNLGEWEGFQVWMRTAGLPNFSKLAMRNNTAAMQAGIYQIEIKMNFPVTKYGGTKSLVISTRTVMGGKNPYLGIAYVIVGGLCVLLGTIFTARHLFKPRKLGDHTYLSWENGPAVGGAAARDGNTNP